jgi:hypothetical protein
MPSPFPGMDPYLEGILWTGFHNDLATETKRQLAATLAAQAPRYHPFSIRDVREDVEDSPDAGVAFWASAPHYSLEVRELETLRLITVIEFLSPVNKYGSGRQRYVNKRRRAVAAGRSPCVRRLFLPREPGDATAQDPGLARDA